MQWAMLVFSTVAPLSTLYNISTIFLCEYNIWSLIFNINPLVRLPSEEGWGKQQAEFSACLAKKFGD